jgi:hypothetical protein
MDGGVYGVLSLFLGKKWFGGSVMGILYIFGGDKWLPMKVTHAVQLPIQFLDEDAKVSVLIDEDTR